MVRNSIAVMALLCLTACAASDKPPVSTGETPWKAATPEPYGTAVSLGDSVWLDEPYLWIRPVEVSEDSRCPADVQCVTGGRAVLRVDIHRNTNPDYPLTTGRNPYVDFIRLEISSDQPIDLFGAETSIAATTPLPGPQGTSIKPNDYRFIFEYKVTDSQPD